MPGRGIGCYVEPFFAASSATAPRATARQAVSLAGLNGKISTKAHASCGNISTIIRLMNVPANSFSV